jgi:hypothetical protein
MSDPTNDADDRLAAVARGPDRLLTAYDVIFVLRLVDQGCPDPMRLLRKWRHLGLLPGVKMRIGNHTRFLYEPEAVQRFIAARRTPTMQGHGDIRIEEPGFSA